MLKTVIVVLVALCMIVHADFQGKCGESITWKLLSDYLLINGTGDLPEGCFDCQFDVSAVTRVDFRDRSSITSIGNGVFEGFTQLRQLVFLRTSPQVIGERAFFDNSLTYLRLPQSLVFIGDSAFEQSLNLEKLSIPNSVKIVGNRSFAMAPLSKLGLGSSLEYIGDEAFSRTVSLPSIEIPKSVTHIGARAFGEVGEFEVEEGSLSFESVDGVLFNKGRTTLIQYPSDKKDEFYTVPETVAIIGKGAFSYNKFLNNVTIPNSVKALSEEAFYHCEHIRRIIIPGSVSSIGDRAFSRCTDLESVIYLGNSDPGSDSSGVFDFSNISSVCVPDNYVSKKFCSLPLLPLSKCR